MKYFAFVLALIVLSPAVLAYTYPKELEQPWDHSPITYSINRTFPPECDPTYVDDFYKGIEYWENGGNGKLSYAPVFREVLPSEKADIAVQFVTNLQNVSEEIGGIANIVLIQGKKFVSTRIRLSCTGIFQREGGEIVKEFSHREVQTTSMHELGHTLGLEHTDDPYDIMTPKQTIQIIPVGFETTSFGIDLSVSQRRTMPGEAVKFSGKAAPNMKLDFIDLSPNKTAAITNKRIIAGAAGNFENTIVFSQTGRFVIEIVNPFSPNVYASTIIFVEDGAEVQVNAPIPTKVFLNGTLAGETPAKLKNLKYGDYQIGCIASGVQDYKTFISVKPGTSDELKAEPSRSAVLCANEKAGSSAQKGFFEKLSEAINEFFRILFS